MNREDRPQADPQTRIAISQMVHALSEQTVYIDYDTGLSLCCLAALIIEADKHPDHMRAAVRALTLQFERLADKVDQPVPDWVKEETKEIYG